MGSVFISIASRYFETSIAIPCPHTWLYPSFVHIRFFVETHPTRICIAHTWLYSSFVHTWLFAETHLSRTFNSIPTTKFIGVITPLTANTMRVFDSNSYFRLRTNHELNDRHSTCSKLWHGRVSWCALSATRNGSYTHPRGACKRFRAQGDQHINYMRFQKQNMRNVVCSAC